MLYEESRTMLFFADDATVGKLMKAAFNYFTALKDPPEVASFNPVETSAYERLKMDADKSWNDYNKIRGIKSDNGKKGGRPRKNTPLTEEQAFENKRSTMINYFKESLAKEASGINL
jgi:hypothetical protein